MQTLADVMGVTIRVADSGQACALGSAMYAAVVSGIYKDINEARKNMCPETVATYVPSASRHEIYNRLYEKYKKH